MFRQLSLAVAELRVSFIRNYAAKAKSDKGKGKAAAPAGKIAKLAKAVRKEAVEEPDEMTEEELKKKAALVSRVEDLSAEDLKATKKMVAGELQQKCTTSRSSFSNLERHSACERLDASFSKDRRDCYETWHDDGGG